MATILGQRGIEPPVLDGWAFAEAGAFAGFALAASLKATNDPAVSKRWMFYTESEAHVLRWADRHLVGESVWTESDERLKAASILIGDDNPEGDLGPRWESGHGSLPSAPYVIASKVTAERNLRVGVPPPDVHTDDIIYDNGETQIAHWVPATPFRP